MENPCLTFVTPTLLAGDKSNTDVVAHEIAHSWSGNLVTTKTWEHFWLNEGLTVFIERTILGRLKGESHLHFSALIGLKDLQHAVDTFGQDHQFTALLPKIDGIDPDDAFSTVPYEKGFNFLFYLRTLLGQQIFEEFLHSYIQKYSYGCVTSQDFKNYFLEFFSPRVEKSVINQIDWETWFYAPGMPKIENKFDTSLATLVYDLKHRWLENNGAGASPEDISNWSAGQKMLFLDELLTAPAALSIPLLGQLEALYKFNETKNFEILFRFCRLCLKSSYEKNYGLVIKMLESQGRMKFTRPLYRELHKVDPKLAMETFVRLKEGYHLITQKMVAKDLQ